MLTMRQCRILIKHPFLDALYRTPAQAQRHMNIAQAA